MGCSWFVLFCIPLSPFLYHVLLFDAHIDDQNEYGADRTAVVSTISPFDSVTSDERAPLHLSEMFRRALQDMVQHNTSHPDDPWSPPEHLWMLVSRTAVSAYHFPLRLFNADSSPETSLTRLSAIILTLATRLRVTEGLERRSILPLEEYLTRHIEARAEMFDPQICGLSEHVVQRRPHINFEVMVRHIGLGTTPEMVEKRAAGRLRRSVKKGR